MKQTDLHFAMLLLTAMTAAGCVTLGHHVRVLPAAQAPKDPVAGSGFFCSAWSMTLDNRSSNCMRTEKECSMWQQGMNGIVVLGHTVTANQCAPSALAWCRYLTYPDTTKSDFHCYRTEEHCLNRQKDTSLGEETSQTECASYK